MARRKGRRGLTRDLLFGSTGAILHEGDSKITGDPIVVIGSGIVSKGLPNEKTGDVIQTWILLRDISPIEAIKCGADGAICGDCKLRPQGENGKLRACYVNIGMAQKVWETYQNGGYPIATRGGLARQLFDRRVVRLGAYGDPVAAPHGFWEEILEPVRGWVGYTHAWRYAPARFKKLVMASVDSPDERRAAKRGKYPWRTFRTRMKHEPLLKGEIQCPAAPEWWQPRARARTLQGLAPKPHTTCEKCQLCDGIKYFPDLRRDISAIVHGWSPNVAAYPIARERGSLPILI